MIRKPRYMVALMSTTPRLAPKVERINSGAVITIGDLNVHMHMEDLRDLCNDIAEVLDVWFDERDREGTSHE